MAESLPKIHVLFVCLGNICRSPMAEGHFLNLIEKAGIADRFVVDSAGTNGLHDGEKADHRMRRTSEGHGITLLSRSRQVRLSDFSTFDHIVAMDHSNLRELQRLKAQVAGAKAILHLMRDHESGGRNLPVPDPYYGGQDGFEDVFRILERATGGFLAYLRKETAF